MVAAVSAVPFLATLGYGFLWDDHVQIEANPWLRNAGWTHFWTSSLWGFRDDLGARYYRPVFGTFLALVHAAGGGRPAAFHAASVLLHSAVACLVAALARRVSGSNAAALVSGLVFGLLPVHAEAVAWVGAQGDLLAALFGTAALLLAAEEPGTRGASLLAGGAFLLAILSKETAVPLVLPLLVLLARGGVRRLPARAAPIMAALLLWGALRRHALGSLLPPPLSAPGGGAADAPALLISYLADLAAPAARVLASVHASGAGDPLAAAGIAAGAVLALLAFRARRHVGVLAALLLFAGALAPALVPGLLGEVDFAERYLYLPSVGLALLAGSAAAALPRAGVRGRVLAVAACAGAALLAAARTRPYRDDVSFFAEASRGNPALFDARNNLGLALLRAGDAPGAVRELESAVRMRPAAADAWTNLGRAHEALGRPADALAAFDRARTLDRSDPAPAAAAARIHRRAGNLREASRVLEALAPGPPSYEVLAERAALALEEGDPAAAEHWLESAIRLFPDRPRAYTLLAQAALLRGDAAEGERRAREALARGGGTLARRLLAASQRTSRIPGSPRPEGAPR